MHLVFVSELQLNFHLQINLQKLHELKAKFNNFHISEKQFSMITTHSNEMTTKEYNLLYSGLF